MNRFANFVRVSLEDLEEWNSKPDFEVEDCPEKKPCDGHRVDNKEHFAVFGPIDKSWKCFASNHTFGGRSKGFGKDSNLWLASAAFNYIPSIVLSGIAIDSFYRSVNQLNPRPEVVSDFFFSFVFSLLDQRERHRIPLVEYRPRFFAGDSFSYRWVLAYDREREVVLAIDEDLKVCADASHDYSIDSSILARLPSELETYFSSFPAGPFAPFKAHGWNGYDVHREREKAYLESLTPEEREKLTGSRDV